MKPLVDADIFLYEVGWGAETGWRAVQNIPKEESCDPPPFDYVAELLDEKIRLICEKVGATEEPLLFLSGSTNFRNDIAKKKGYKANRKDSAKPFHYENIKAYLKGKYNVIVTDGIEADDAMCIEQVRVLKELGPIPFKVTNEQLSKYTIICSRDKDLKMCPGCHYSWELGKQPSFGPFFVEGFGKIALDGKKKLRGWGDIWFYAQLLMGDPTDNIPGIPRLGGVGAFNILSNTSTKEEAHKAVVEAYKGFYGDSWEQEMLEQGQLLWMVREIDSDGKPIMWKLN